MSPILNITVSRINVELFDNVYVAPQDTLDYKKKQRPLKIRMLDGTVKTVMVDDSKIVSDMLMTICARIGQPVQPSGFTI